MFDAVFCINLERRVDRFQSFCVNYPAGMPPVKRILGTDGQSDTPEAQPAGWWKQSRGAWGDDYTHYRIMNYCKATGKNSFLVFEDDATPTRPTVGQEYACFIAELPSDWQMVYLGGQLFNNPTRQVSEHVYIPQKVLACHAYGLREPLLTKIRDTMFNPASYARLGNLTSLDQFYTTIHPGMPGLYCPDRWMFIQPRAYSDVLGCVAGATVWPDAVDRRR